MASLKRTVFLGAVSFVFSILALDVQDKSEIQVLHFCLAIACGAAFNRTLSYQEDISELQSILINLRRPANRSVMIYF
jgi:hypothetical protein